MSKTPNNVEREIHLVAAIYNNMIDRAVSQGHVGVRVRVTRSEDRVKTGRKRAAEGASAPTCHAIDVGGGGECPDTGPAGADRKPAGADRKPAGADRKPAGADRKPAGDRKTIGSKPNGSEDDEGLVGAKTEYG